MIILSRILFVIFILGCFCAFCIVVTYLDNKHAAKEQVFKNFKHFISIFVIIILITVMCFIGSYSVYNKAFKTICRKLWWEYIKEYNKCYYRWYIEDPSSYHTLQRQLVEQKIRNNLYTK